MGMDNPIPIIPITNIYFDTYPEKGKDLTKGSKDLAVFFCTLNLGNTMIMKASSSSNNNRPSYQMSKTYTYSSIFSHRLYFFF